MEIISVVTHMSGTGKTTTSVSIAGALRDKGYTVLVIDLDPQGSATKHLYGQEVDNTVGDLMFHRASLKNILIRTGVGIDLLPSAVDDSSYEEDLTNETDFFSILEDALESVSYDFIIIDCPPSLGNLTVNALYLSDFYLIPVLLDSCSLDGIKNIVQTANKIKPLNQDLELLGVLVTKYNEKQPNAFDRTVYQQLQEVMGDKLFTTAISYDKSFIEAVVNAQDIFSYSPKSNGAQNYRSLTEEILVRIRA